MPIYGNLVGGQSASSINIDLSGSHEGEVNLINADSLGGYSPEHYATVEQLTQAAPRNLLDNSDFTNPVNQRGNTTTTAAWTYWLDRWRTTYMGSATVGEQGVTIDASTATNSCGIRQFIEKLSDGKYTAVIYNADGTVKTFRNYTVSGTTVTAYNIYSSTGNSSYILLGFGNNSYMLDCNSMQGYTETFGMVALYEGEYTIKTLPRYQSKGYDAEIDACYQYYYQCTAEQAWGYYIPGQAFGPTEARITFSLPRRMKRNPTVTIQDFSKVDMATGNGSVVCTGLAAASAVNNNHAIVLRLTPKTNLTTGALLMVRINTLITISCDL